MIIFFHTFSSISLLRSFPIVLLIIKSVIVLFFISIRDKYTPKFLSEQAVDSDKNFEPVVIDGSR